VTIINISSSGTPSWSSQKLKYSQNNNNRLSPESASTNKRLLQRRRHSDDGRAADLKDLVQKTQSRKQNGRVSSEGLIEHAAGKVLDKYRKRAKSDAVAPSYVQKQDRLTEGRVEVDPEDPQLPRKLRPIRPKSAKSSRPGGRMAMSSNGNDDASTRLSCSDANDLTKRKLTPIKLITIDTKAEDSSSRSRLRDSECDASPQTPSPRSPLAVLAPIPRAREASPGESLRDYIDVSAREKKAVQNQLEPALQDFLVRNQTIIIPTQVGPELDDF
jgi:hypothetical protein